MNSQARKIRLRWDRLSRSSNLEDKFLFPNNRLIFQRTVSHKIWRLTISVEFDISRLAKKTVSHREAKVILKFCSKNTFCVRLVATTPNIYRGRHRSNRNNCRSGDIFLIVIHLPCLLTTRKRIFNILFENMSIRDSGGGIGKERELTDDSYFNLIKFLK